VIGNAANPLLSSLGGFCRHIARASIGPVAPAISRYPIYIARHLERFLSKIERCRGVAARYAKIAADDVAFSRHLSVYGCAKHECTA